MEYEEGRKKKEDSVMDVVFCFAAKKQRAQAVLYCPRGIVRFLICDQVQPHQPHRTFSGYSAYFGINKVPWFIAKVYSIKPYGFAFLDTV